MAEEPHPRSSLTLTRSYKASPEKVWQAWTNPKAVMEWDHPGEGFTTPVVEVDLRVGGRFRIVMVSPQGEEFEATGVYREVVPNRKLVYTWTWAKTPERETLVTVILRPSGRGTELELRHEGLFDPEERDSHRDGWSNSLEALGHYLASSG